MVLGGSKITLSSSPNTHTHTIRARLRVPRAHARRGGQAVHIQSVVPPQHTRARKICERHVRSRGRPPPHLVHHVGQEGQRVVPAAGVEGPREEGFAVCEAGGARGALVQAARGGKSGQAGRGGQAGPRHDDDGAEGRGSGEQGGEGVWFGAGGVVRRKVDTPACVATSTATHTHTHIKLPHLSRRRLRRRRRPLDGSSCAIALVSPVSLWRPAGCLGTRADPVFGSRSVRVRARGESGGHEATRPFLFCASVFFFIPFAKPTLLSFVCSPPSCPCLAGRALAHTHSHSHSHSHFPPMARGRGRGRGRGGPPRGERDEPPPDSDSEDGSASGEEMGECLRLRDVSRASV